MEIELIDPDEVIFLPENDSPGDAEGDDQPGELPQTPKVVAQTHTRHESGGVRIHTSAPTHSRTDSTAASEISDTDGSKVLRKYKGYRLGERVALATKQRTLQNNFEF